MRFDSIASTLLPLGDGKGSSSCSNLRMGAAVITITITIQSAIGLRVLSRENDLVTGSQGTLSVDIKLLVF